MTRHRPTATVLVTGANSGIGSACVARLVDRGADVIATVRSDDAERSLRVAHPDREFRVERLDLTDPEGGVAIIRRCRPDVVVHNATSAHLGPLSDAGDDDIHTLLETQLVGPARIDRAAIAQWREEGADRPPHRGRIVGISSVLASTTIPFTGWYGAAKAAFDSLGDTLAVELRPSGIDVIRVECGAVRTDAWATATDDVTDAQDATTIDARDRWAHLMSAARPLFASADQVAAKVADAALDPKPRAVYRVGLSSCLGPLSDVVPVSVERAIASTLFGLLRRTDARESSA